MEEEMEGRQRFPPYHEGKNVPFRAEEVIKILKNVKDSDHVNSIPENPLGGDVYIFKPASEDKADDWKCDGLRWKSVSSVHLPRNKKPLVWKRTFTLQDGAGVGEMKKDVYSWEMGEGEENVCLVHYIGKTADTQAAAAKTAGSETSEVDQSGTSAETEEQAEESPVETAVEESGGTTAAGGENRAELEAAMKAMQAALGSKGKTTPVMDVFNKLMETVVSNKDNPDLELCLVVADKKSGESSLTGSEEAKRIVATPIRRSARKRRASTDEDQTEEEEPDEDEEEEPVARKPAHKKPKVIISKRPLKQITRTPEDNVVTLASGRTERIPVPKKEVFFSPLIVSSEEKRIHSEFFDDSHPNRTQQKYLKLRNHIINNWCQVKPLYLGSNQARKGLQKVGDVGVFRRIFKYLECKGVINFDATPKRAQFEDDEESHEEDEEEEKAERSRKRTPASKSADKSESTPTPGKSSPTPTPSKRSRGRPLGSTSSEAKVKLKTKIKQEPIDPDLILSPTGRSRRNRTTPNWADILGGRATFYKDAALAKEVIEDEGSDEESRGRGRGRPRKPATDDDEEGEEEAVSTPRGRGRPRKNESVNKPKPADGDEVATPRPRGRPRKDGSSSSGNVAKSQELVSSDVTQSVRKRGRPRKISTLNEDGTEVVAGESQTRAGDTGSNDEAETRDQAEDMETEEGNKDAGTEANLDDTASSDFQSGGRLQYRYSCIVCSKGFTMKYLLKEHVDLVHTRAAVKTEEGGLEEEPYLDDDMDEDYQPEVGEATTAGVDADMDDGSGDDSPREKKAKTYSDSYKRALKANRPTCDVCGTVFLTMGNLRKHYLLHSNKMYECPYCAKLMKRKDYVVAHIRKCHKDVDLLKDPVDFRKFTHVLSSENLEGELGLPAGGNDDGEDVGEPGDVEPGDAEEKKPRTGLGKSVCPECLNVFDTTADLEVHMTNVHQKVLEDSSYKCAACKKEFKSLVSFQVHKLSHRKKEHECAHCGAIFRTNSQLQVHKRHDHNIQYGTLMYFGFLMVKDRITCEICSADFDTMADYHEHRPEHLSLEFLCSVCGNGFMSAEELQRHTESNCVYQNLHLPCGVCDQKFSMYDARRKHVLANHKKTSDMNCHHCGACFLNLESLRTHFTLHKSERIFECEFCEKRFFEKRNLVDHRELHRDNKSYQCTICERMYISSKSLQRHIKLHLAGGDQRTCQTCDIRFGTNEELMRHMEQQHSTVTAGREPSNTENFDHQCEICGRKFLFKSRLVKHMQIHNDEDQKADTYQCPTCNGTYDTSTMPLWKHMKQDHPEEMKKKSWKRERMCEICGFTTVHKQRLERHMETHNPEKKFQCRYCEKMFQTTSSMLTHMIIHRGKIKKGVKSHSACSWPLCNKTFLKHSNMKRHLISHIFRVKVNKDWCDCKDCDKRNEEFLTNQTGEYEYFEDDGSGSFVKVSAEAMMSRGIAGANDDAQMNAMGMNNTAGMEGYESMDVLQEAIAQIEDIEKNAGSSTAATSEAAQTIQTASSMADPGTQLDGTQAAPLPNETLPTVVSNIRVHRNPGKVKSEGLVAGQVEVTGSLDTGLGTSIAETEESVTMVNGESEMAGHHDMDGLFGQESGGGVTECIYECGVCDLMFETKCQVLYHLEDEHVDNRFPKCEECGKFYIDKKNLNEHSTIHLGSREFSCDVCAKTFRTKQCLRQHAYIHAEVKPFICTYCGHGFTQRGFFDEHVRRHTGDKPFRCIVCSKGFVSKNLLKLHMYQHTGNKPHKCPSCPKAFAENYQLVAHMRTHSDDRPFQCSECDKAFFVKPKLIRHMNTVHSIEKQFLTSYVPTKVGNGVGYRDRGKMKDDRKTQVVYIDGQGNIISQQVTTEAELKRQKTRIRNKPHIQRAIRQAPVTSSQQVVVVQPPTATADTLTETSQPGNAFEVVTRRDSSGQIQVNTVNMDRSEHVIVENDGLQLEEQQVVMQNSDGSETIVSLPEHGDDNIVYQEMEAGEGSIELDGQNYTLVTQSDGVGGGQSHLQLITQALAAGVQGGELEGAGGSEIRVITEEVGQEGLVEGGDAGAGGDPGSIQIYTEETVEGVMQNGAENISINIGEDGTVDAADFEKIEALRSLYNDQPIVIVLESQQQ